MFRYTDPRHEARERLRVATPLRQLPALIAGLAILLSASGCGLFETRVHHPGNQPPVLTLTSGPVDTVSVPLSWVVNLSWTAVDPDGFVDHYEYAIDPPTARQAMFAAADTVWVTTHETQLTVHFRASQPDSLGPGATASDFHVFLLRAVDSRGARSPLLVRAFYAYTVAPDVHILKPLPNAFFSVAVPAAFRIEWQGDDPDGAGSREPEAYFVRVLHIDAPGSLGYLLDPDSLRREGIRTDWAGWHAVPAGEHGFDVGVEEGFAVGNRGAAVVLARDAAGAVTPYVNLNLNMVAFSIADDASMAPRIRVWGAGLDFAYAIGGWSLDTERQIPLEVGAGIPFTLHWSGTPAFGHDLVSSRWMLDGDPTDDTPRTSDADLAHWSAFGPPAGSADLPGIASGEHFLYIEMVDDFGLKSLAIVRIRSVTVAFDRDLLIVDDTRLEVDKFSAGCPTAYTQAWPSATELDTFLFARGGVPWRCTLNPAGATSTPGLFAGYAFDTLGTRLGFANSADAVSLSTLLRYRNVVWLVDGPASNLNLGSTGLFPMTALRAMSVATGSNKLAAYAALGGHVWLAGGGGANATLAEFDRVRNNSGQTVRYSVEESELAPGRLMYDAAHVRSELSAGRTVATFARSPAARGGWSGHGPSGTLAAPDYLRLPVGLRLRSPANDPLPPTRAPGRESLYYLTAVSLEFVSRANDITESFDSPGGGARLESTLDTLFEASSVALGVSNAPAMLYYHGREHTPFVYSGFSLWDWTRPDAQQLVDFVLQDVWGLSKSAPAVSMARAPSSWSMRRVDPAVRRP